MSDYVLYSRLCCLVMSALLIWSIAKTRYIVIKPSIAFLFFFHTQIQWSAAYHAPWIEEFLIAPWDYFYLTHVFPLVSLAFVRLTFRKTASETFGYLVEFKGLLDYHKFLISVVAILIGGIALWYFATVPISHSGLYTALADPESYVQARQAGMQELGNVFLRYGFSFITNASVPVLAIILVFKFRLLSGLFSKLYIIIGIIGLVALVSIFGARGPSVYLMLSILYAVLLRSGFPIKPLRLFFATAAILTVPALIVFAYRAGGIEGSLGEAYLSVIDRVFGRNIKSTIWTVDYVQKFGFFGLAGIQKLAPFFGYEPVDPFNIIGLHNSPNSFESISATSSFIYNYYSCFGFIALPLCVFLTISLDTVFWIYNHLPGNILLPCVAACAVVSSKLAHTAFTSTMITGGFLLIPLFGIILNFTLQVFRVRSDDVGTEGEIEINGIKNG